MFVQRPQTTHVPRHYTNTVKKTNHKNVDKENAGALPSKTPSKGVLKGGTGMLIPNTVRLGKSVAGDKGKGKEEDIAPKRLFASTSQSQFIKPSKSFGNLPTIRPNKTPAKAVRTPAPAKREVMATPLPSASKPRRSRQSFTPSVPVIDKAQFTTPSAKQWEEGESLESITEGIHEIGLGGVVEEEEGGDGDVEHMPPRSIPLPHVPIGAIDCCAEEFKVFNDLPVLWGMKPQEDIPPAPPCEEVSLQLLDFGDDDDLEEPMFRRPKAVSTQTTSNAASTSRTVRPSIATARAPTPASRLAGSSHTSTVPSRTPRSIPSTLRSTPSTTRTPITRDSRLTKQVSTLSLKPAPVKAAPIPDLSHLVDEFPEIEISLDFGHDF